jgi:hypothetical protein
MLLYGQTKSGVNMIRFNNMAIRIGCYLTLLMGTISWPLTVAYAQDFDEFGTEERFTPLHILDIPTAAVASRGTATMTLRILSRGGLLSSIYAGVSDRFLLGISFGGSNIIGTGDISWNPRPEVAIKYLMIGETETRPGLAVGFESQGYGSYNNTLNRYQIKALGFYGILSRNFSLAGTFGMHAGVNYSIENKDEDDRLNVFIGADKSINPHLTFLIEYDFARNDNQSLPGFGRDKGYLNIGARITLGDRVGLEFDLRNLLDNRVGAISPSRELRILYSEPFDF